MTYISGYVLGIKDTSECKGDKRKTNSFNAFTGWGDRTVNINISIINHSRLTIMSDKNKSRIRETGHFRDGQGGPI